MSIVSKFKKIIRVNRASRHKMPDGITTSLFICTQWNICFRNILNIAAIHRHNGEGLYFVSPNPHVFYWYIEVPYVKQNLRFGFPKQANFIYTDSVFLYKLLSKRRENVRLVTYARDNHEVATRELFPYFLHPEVVWNRPFRSGFDNSLHRRIFFSGNQIVSIYAKDDIMPKRFGVPNRIDSINFLKEKFKFVSTANVFAANLPNGYELVINNDTIGNRLSPQEYEEQMEQCDFFIGLPGMIMPLCHNAMEAMAKGKILITPCPDWFSPKLSPGVNCFSYQSNEDLLAILLHCTTLSEDRIAAMKAAAQLYLKRLNDREKNALGKDIFMVNEDRASLRNFYPLPKDADA